MIAAGAARAALLAAATLATWAPLVWLSHLAVPPPQSIPGALSRAEFVAASGDVIPADDAPWQEVRLPDDWRDRRPGVLEGWYRIRFPSPPEATQQGAVYLPFVAMNAAVYLNGELVGHGGRFAEPVARNWNRPLLFSFPAAMLRAGESSLQLHVKSDVVDGGLVPIVHVAPADLLEDAYARAEFIRRTLVLILMVFRIVLAAFTAAIWAMWRKEAYYGWFALCALAWAFAELNLVVVEPPVSTAAWYWLVNVAIGWWGITAVRLVLSFIGLEKPRAAPALTAFGIVGSLALGMLAASGSRWFLPLGVNVWLTLTFIASCTMFQGVLPRLRRHPDQIELNVVFVVALSVIGCVLFDLVMQLGLRARGGLAIPAYGSFVAISGMGWVLVRRFVGALRDSRALGATLETRVAEKHAELERRYREIAEIDRARMLSEERERILADMQDGLGGQLVSTLALVDRPETRAEELGAAVRAALDDLRLVIDSLDPIDGEILPALGMLRLRMQPRFEAAGIRVRWEVDDLPPSADIGPHKLLTLLRILQQLFAAALRVRGGGELVMRTAVEPAAAGGDATVIDVELLADEANVEAFRPELTRIDLDHLERRARDIGATITATGIGERKVAIRIAMPIRG